MSSMCSLITWANYRLGDVYYTGFALSARHSVILLIFCYSVLIRFPFNSLRTNRRSNTKLCIPIIMDKICVGIVKHHFPQIFNRVTALDSRQNLVLPQYLENEWVEINQILYKHYYGQNLLFDYKASYFCRFATALRPLIDVRMWFLLYNLRMNGQNVIKLCIQIIIEKIYVGFNRATALD